MADLEKLDKTIIELEIQSKDLKEFNKVYSDIGKLKQDISDNLKLLKNNNDSLSLLSKEVQVSIENSKKHLETIESGLHKKVQEQYQDNKNFQKELDASLVSRLEKHKSDIQVEIRNEGTQIQRAFETALNSNFNSMESKIKENFSLQTKQLNILKILLFVIIGIGIGLAIGLYLK
ncbi:MAG: hypothetical protein M3Q58_06775 [Bacteroidota bacterium]|nr:hypothetical protein [Bacteroidota bacterium]